MLDTVQEWHAEDVIFERRAAATGIHPLAPNRSHRWNGIPRMSFLKHLEYFPSILPTKVAKSGLKHAPQRRGYTRSLPMGPIDGRKTCFEGRDPEITGNHQHACQEWDPEDVIFEAFCMILQAFWPPKLAKNGLKDAPQRRGHTRSLPMGPIDGTHGKHRKSSKMQEIMPDTVQEWHAEDVIVEAFWSILLAFWPPKLAKSDLKHAPQRRGYTRSLPMGPIDGTHGCAQKTVERCIFCMIFLEKATGVWSTVSPCAAKIRTRTASSGRQSRPPVAEARNTVQGEGARCATNRL
eukprot:gene24509-biopygen2914